MHDIFGPGSNVQGRIRKDYKEIRVIVEHCRGLGLKIVLTSGTFDLFHVGHSRYLEQAKQHGDVLVVGTDSDAKVRKSKGPNRPIVAEEERMEILCHCRHVDVVFLKGADDLRWQLIKTVQPDVLIATKATYKEAELLELRQYCGEIVVLEPQATTSTTAKVRRIMLDVANQVRQKLDSALKEVNQFLEAIGEDGGAR
jgi:rfaE bifunctional protein nucleotidyltransferase chain/domain